MIAWPNGIPPEGVEKAGEDSAEDLDIHEDGVLAISPMHYRLRLQVASRELVAMGRLSARFEFRCVRCGQLFEQDVTEPDFICSLPFSEEDASVDLTPEMREAIILRFSSHPVCREDCKGLCVQCGEDLNVGRCDCSKKPVDGRWSALSELEL